MITIVKFMPDEGAPLFLPSTIQTTWEGELPVVGDALLNIEVRVDCISKGPEIGGFNNSVPAYKMLKVVGTVTGRCWLGPGIIAITYKHDRRVR